MFLPLLCLLAAPAAEIRIDPADLRANVNPHMFGIFFEEINQAGDGGVYPELVRARGMEDGNATRLPTGWSTLGTGGTVALDTASPLNAARRHSLKIVRRDDPVAAVNEGYWGIPATRGARYRLTLWVRGEVPLEAALLDSKGGKLATAAFQTGNGWARFETVVRSSGTDAKARLALTPTKPGTAWVAYASLVPLQTRDGLRPDLAEKIAAMRPGFVRFPGGCFVEGNDLAQAFDWKKSIGPKEQRAAMPAGLWGYPSTNGLGFLEYLQWCEDLGAEPLFVINCGMSHTQVAPMSQMDAYVQSALDAIEYANGPATSKWGALRAAHGRPKPFRLRYVEIGNENGGPAYDERYRLIAQALDAKYPDLLLIANVWGGVPRSYPLEIIDEHYYNTPAWFWRQTQRYDRTDRRGPKIYVGEYAVTSGAGQGNLAAALSEAAFMTGMLRNADIVRMASYAPLLVNVNNRQWNPNAIVFDNRRSYGTPSYWVQRLFGEHRPDRILGHQVLAPTPELRPTFGGFGLQTWLTQAEFRDIVYTVDGRTVFRADEATPARIENQGGQWTAAEGVIRQTSEEENRRMVFRAVDVPDARRAELRLRARKLAGKEGFIIMFAIGQGRELQWNLGGWINTVHAFQENGARFGAGVPGQIETGRWYDIRIEREGGTIRGFLDGKLVEEVREEPGPDFAAVAGLDTRRREIVVFAVNGAGTSRETRLSFGGARVGPGRGYTIAGPDLAAENSFAEPEKMRIRPFPAEGPTVRLKPYSASVLRFALR